MLVEQIKQEEGFSPKVYVDTEGYPTIGFGRLLEKKKMTQEEAEAKYGNLIVTEEEAEKNLRDYLNEAALPDAIKFVGEDNFSSLKPEQQEALVSMAYNLGSGTLNKFKGLKKAIQEGDLNKAAFEILDSNASSQALDRYAKIASTFGELPSAEKLRTTTSGKKLLTRLQSQKESGSYVPEEYNYLLQEEVPMARPTNPEAGPSDTVPAMLTPGEAVIPAPAAQNPENKKQIAEMLNEGRVKNDIAEANGVPVTSPEVANIPKEEVGGGFFSNIKEALGFEGGTMEVPNMGMMIPPKDPTMDKMEQLAFKQMDYEMKSKNRTRDTVEKIGLKHLEDTATAEMKQMALDETMRNYGLEVPMPMQPVPQAQGFQQGTGNVSYFNPEGFSKNEMYADRPGLGFVQTFGGGPKLMEDVSDAELAEISRFGQTTAEQMTAGSELERRMSQVPMGSEVTRVTPEVPIKIAGSDTTITPPKPVQQVVLPEVEKAKVTPKDTSGNTSGLFSSLGKTLGAGFTNAFKTVFDPQSIATAGIYYGVNRLLGYDDATAAKQAAIGYQTGQQQLALRAKLEAEALKDTQKTQAQRDKEDISNQAKLREASESQFKTAFDQVLTKEGSQAAYGTTPEALTGEVVAALRNQGVDMSDPMQVEYAMNLVPSVVQQYKESMQRGEEILSVQDAFDRVFRSKLEVSDALSVKDDEGEITGVVKTGVTAPLFNQIRKNIPNANTPSGQAEFESRLSAAYKLFQERKGDINLPAPGPGENEFTVFLREVLNQGSIRDFKK